VIRRWGVICALLAVPAAVSSIELVSVQDEIAIGREANSQVRKQTPQLDNAEISGYVRTIARRLTQVAPGPKYPYSFSIADYREINAFALPGGPVWINRGVMHSATNESQVAGVLAHEIAHVAQRHAADQLTKAALTNFGLGVLGAILGNSGGAGTAQIAARVFANGAFLRFSRNDELEADRVGLQILTRAGWDARGMVELFENIRREANRDPSKVEVLLSSHPSPRDRISALQPDVQRFVRSGPDGGRSSGRRDTPQFQAVKARLLKMPAPRRMPKN
jgi:predicted Zn-dependent protease